jgi:hypothetical protein
MYEYIWVPTLAAEIPMSYPWPVWDRVIRRLGDLLRCGGFHQQELAERFHRTIHLEKTGIF